MHRLHAAVREISSNMDINQNLSQIEAHTLIVQWMRKERRDEDNSYGYDVYLPTMISNHLGHPPYGQIELYMRKNMPAFCAAAWELCRRGFLRPGVHHYGKQGNSDGYGYSITPLGETWLAEAAADKFISVEPGQLAQKFTAYRSRFGDGYHQRAQEAAKCYAGNTYLACCAMCGAAAESIILAVACAKKSSDKVLKIYKSASGRRQIQNLVLGAAPEHIRKHALAQLSVTDYWRDDASHGALTPISEAEAFTALLLVLRLAILIDDNWAELARP
jgi:hypothetical protein